MRLPIPDPRDLAASLVGLPERLFGLLDAAEGLLGRAEGVVGRVNGLLERIEETRQGADAVVARVDAVVDDAEPLVRRLAGLLDRLEPPLTTLEPTLRTLADTTSPEEVAALVTMVDHLPELTRRLVDVAYRIAQDLAGLRLGATAIGFRQPLDAFLGRVVEVAHNDLSHTQ